MTMARRRSLPSPPLVPGPNPGIPTRALLARGIVAGTTLTLTVLAGSLLAGCGLIFEETGTPAADARATSTAGFEADTAGLPEGMGSLRHNEISVYLRRGELQVRVTPLAESIIRVTAPDTWERLSALGRGHQRMLRERTGSAVPFQLFLVAVHAEAERMSFEPMDLTLISRGVRYRPLDIRAVTPAWTRQQVAPGETLMAVYAFPPEVDLSGSLEVEYQEIRDRSWDRLLPRIQAERARIRGRPDGL